MTEWSQRVNQGASGRFTTDGKYLTFMLAEEEYGIGILEVKEIIRMMPITTVPRTPAFVKGVINLRGKVIPVVDLRVRFGLTASEYTERTCIIVVELASESGALPIGMVVDAVSEVLHIKREDLEAAPTFGGTLDTAYILGMAKVDGGLIILLDIEAVLMGEDFGTLSVMDEEVTPDGVGVVMGRCHPMEERGDDVTESCMQ